MKKIESLKYLMKLDMIVDREAMMTEAQLANEKYFPNFICVRKLAITQGKEEQFLEFVKEINATQKQLDDNQKEMVKKIEDIQKDIKEMFTALKIGSKA